MRNSFLGMKSWRHNLVKFDAPVIGYMLKVSRARYTPEPRACRPWSAAVSVWLSHGSERDSGNAMDSRVSHSANTNSGI